MAKKDKGPFDSRIQLRVTKAEKVAVLKLLELLRTRQKELSAVSVEDIENYAEKTVELDDIL